MNKKGQGKESWVQIGALLILAAIALQQFGYIGTPTPKAIEGGQVNVVVSQTPTSGTAGGSQFAITEDTSASFYMKNVYLPTTLLTTEFARVFVTEKDSTEETDKGLVAHGGSLTVSPFDTLRVYFGENSTTYYTEEKILSVKDKGTLSMTGPLAQADTALTFTKFDENDAVSTFSTNFTLGTEATTYYVKVKVASDKGWSNPTVTQGPAMCLEYNTTAWKSPSMTKETTADTYEKMKIIGNPSSIAVVAGKNLMCWEGEIEGDGSATKYKLDLESNVNVDESVGNQIKFYTEDVDIDIDADDTTKIIGYVDEDGNDLGQVDQNVAIAFS